MTESQFSQASKRLRRIGIRVVGMVMMFATCCWMSMQVASAQEVPTNANPTPQQAADIQSIINVWTAYANNLDSNNPKGVAALMLPTSGYTFQTDTQTMPPSACGPQPSAGTPCLPQGACAALGYNGVQVFLPAVGYTPPHPEPARGHHSLGTYVVKLGPDGTTATLYVYFNDGRYINDYVKTRSGWKVKWERIIWPGPTTFTCRVDWSRQTNLPGLLGTDLYYMQLLSSGPQLPASVASNPSLQQVDSMLNQILLAVNEQQYAQACPIMNNLVSFVSRDPGINADYRDYFTALAGRFLEDNACNGLSPPDRTVSNGGWAAAAGWRAYQLSGAPGAIATPSQIPPWSDALIRSNQ